MEQILMFATSLPPTILIGCVYLVFRWKVHRLSIATTFETNPRNRPTPLNFGVLDLMVAVAALALYLAMLQPFMGRLIREKRAEAAHRTMKAAPREIVLDTLCREGVSIDLELTAFFEMHDRGFVDGDRPALVRAFADESRPWNSRGLAASALIECPAPHPEFVLEALARGLESEDLDVQQSAARALAAMAPDSPQPGDQWGDKDIPRYRRWWAERQRAH